MDKAESVKVKLELKTFDEIFGEGWWDKGEAEDLKTPAPTNFGQNVHHQIDRQNTQIGQIELGQIEPNSTDQNPLPLSETDHSDNAKNDEEQNEITSNENIAEDARKHKIIDKFQAIKDEFKQKGKYSKKEWNQIEEKIAKHLKVNRQIIYKWKKEFGLSRKVLYEKEERKHLIEKFDQRKAELTRAGFKNSYHNEINEIVAKVLGLSFRTIYNWKRELGQIRTIYSDDEKLQIVKKLMQMESAHSGGNENLAKSHQINTPTHLRQCTTIWFLHSPEISVQQRGLLHQQRICGNCGHEALLKDRIALGAANTWFDPSKLEFHTILKLQEVTSVNLCEKELCIAHGAVVDWAMYLREVSANHVLLQQQQQIGGQNMTVEIDEAPSRSGRATKAGNCRNNGFLGNL
uniref:Uncharacterized protein n=1 Tax=Globodera rostochiensis TaxID=31243 RepID=A0A914HRX2_GLORO